MDLREGTELLTARLEGSAAAFTAEAEEVSKATGVFADAIQGTCRDEPAAVVELAFADKSGEVGYVLSEAVERARQYLHLVVGG